MALQYIVDNLDSIPETLHSEYAEKDGKFYLNVEGLPDVPDVPGLKSALQKERELSKENQKRAALFEQFGKKPAEIADILQKHEELASKAGNVDALIAQHQKKWGIEKATLETELNASRNSERGAIIATSITAALAKGKATPEGVDLLAARLGERIHLETVEGKRVIRIMEADGKRPMAGSGADGAATYADLVKEAVKQYPSLFEGTGAGGGGKKARETPNTGDKTITRAEWDNLNPYEQRAKHNAGFKLID